MRRIFLTAFAIWLSDFLTKQWAIATLGQSPQELIGSWLQLTLVKNSGAAFGLAGGLTILFTIFSCAVATAVIYFARIITARGWQLTAGLLLGGVLGNLSDRVFRAPSYLSGHVIDWIQIPYWPVFNLADCAIVSAAAIAFILSVRNISPVTPVR